MFISEAFCYTSCCSTVVVPFPVISHSSGPCDDDVGRSVVAIMVKPFPSMKFFTKSNFCVMLQCTLNFCSDTSMIILLKITKTVDKADACCGIS